MASELISAEELTKPLVRRKKLSARNDGTMMTVIDTGEFGLMVTDEPVPHGGTGEGPSPLQAVLGALCGCESVTFNRTAAEMDFKYDGIDFEAEFTIDIRGRLGVREVRQHFQTIRVQATLYTTESEERIQAAIEETEARCPVYNLVVDAGVKLEMLWVHQPSRDEAAKA
jgi:uncharacterized OsmC-like protein